MMRIVSVPFFNLRNGYTTKRTRPPVEKPRRFHRCSDTACSRSSQSSASGSAKTVGTPCLSVVGQGLVGIRREHIYVYTLIAVHSPTKEKGGPPGPAFSL